MRNNPVLEKYLLLLVSAVVSSYRDGSGLKERLLQIGDGEYFAAVRAAKKPKNSGTDDN